MTQGIEEKDAGRLEQGGNGRNISANHKGGNPILPVDLSPFKERPQVHQEVVASSSNSSDAQKESSESSDGFPESPEKGPPMHRPESFRRNIAFADELNPDIDSNGSTDRLPQQMSAEQHIAFLENQRNPKDKSTLRIPNPRDYERGLVPAELGHENDSHPLDRVETHSTDPHAITKHDTDHENEGDNNADDHTSRRNITIVESNPNHPRHNTNTSQGSKMTLRRPATSASKLTPILDKPSSIGLSRTHGATISSRTNTREKDLAPYLSWQPTMGRNSAFVDLTEEQREELGGIEYRSLKTLAIVLVCMLRPSEIGAFRRPVY